MTAEVILDRLDGVRQTGRGFVARCPAHEDGRPSLSIRETSDGRVLLHCFAGCDAEAVLAAVGLTFSDLYPEQPGQHFKPERHRFDARAALECVYHEALVVSVIVADMAAGETLTDEHQERLTMAASRLSDAMSAA